MITVFEAFTAEELEKVRALIADVPPDAWTDGKETAGVHIRHRKQNQQLKHPPAELAKLMGNTLMQRQAFMQHAWPEEISTMISRYRESDGYDFHVDNAVRGAGKRRDIALSIALNDDYEGGDLVFKFGSLHTGVRLKAGQAVMFPSQLEHKVNPVTAGERLVAIVWVSSRIADPMDREILYALQTAQELIHSDKPEDRDTVVTSLAFGTQNLLKRWLR